MTRLAVRKDEGSIVGGGFHYMLHPIVMHSVQEEGVFALMGYSIIEVEDAFATDLITAARAALKHQVEVACLVDGPNHKRVPS